VASRLGVVLRTGSEGLPVFWPAAGIAIGALIALGPNARWPVAAAVAAATIACSLIACSLMTCTSPWLAITFSLVNAGQALLTAWLIERWFGGVFNLDDVPQVLGFLATSAIGAAVAAAAATIAVSFVEPTAFSLNVWRLWFASYLLGTVTVAPPLVGLGEVLREPPSRGELIEGTVGLVILAALSVFFISLPLGPWATALPVAFVFPVLFWIAVRCRPVFAAAAALVVTTAIMCSITFDMGHFGDASIALADRILAAQTFVLAGALLALVLAALFADWRRREAELKLDISERKKAELSLAERNMQLALAGKAALVGSFAYDASTEKMQISAGYAALHGFPDGTTEIMRSEWQVGVHSDDRARLEEIRSLAVRGRWDEYSAEYRIVRSGGEARWVEARVFILYGSDGPPRRMVGVNIDVTERIDHRVKNVLATVSAIITQTQETNSSFPDFVAALDGRIQSLARTHDLLSDNQWHGVRLAEIVRRELAPYASDNAEIGGPSATLKWWQWCFMSWPPTPQNTGRFPTEAADCWSDGRGYKMGRMIGWPSNGRRSAVHLFYHLANLDMGQG
jgi:PAS domain S-box-containing protein